MMSREIVFMKKQESIQGVVDAWNGQNSFDSELMTAADNRRERGSHPKISSTYPFIS